MPAISEPALEPIATSDAVNTFISRWQDKGGTEKANYQLFLTELCTLLNLPQPDPLRMVFRDNGFVSDAVKINVEQIFRQLSSSTEVRSL